MNDFVNVVVNNGIGVGSFLALLYFSNTYILKMNQTLEQVSSTLTSINESLHTLSNRVDIIENKIKEKE